MICSHCQKAGSQARAVVSQPPEVRGGAAAGQLDMALHRHVLCKGGTWCDCGHQAPVPVPPRQHEAGSD